MYLDNLGTGRYGTRTPHTKSGSQVFFMNGNIRRSVVIALLISAAAFVASSRRGVSATVDNGFSFPSNFESQSQDGEKPAEEVYKNIQVLKGLPASQVNSVMN